MIDASVIDRLRKVEDQLAELQAQDVVGGPAYSWGTAASSILALPGLVGFWPGGVYGADSSTPTRMSDISSHGLHLTINGGVVITRVSTWPLLAHLTFNGSNGYLTHSDASIFDITGSAGGIGSAIEGLTIGGWFYWESGSATQGLMTKWIGSGDERSYRISLESNDKVSFAVSSDGTSGGIVSVPTDTATSQQQWFFSAGRFEPSTEIAVWLNDAQATNTTSIPATIHSGTATFQMGAINSVGGNLLDGRMALCFLCSAYVHDAIITSLYEQTRGLFGV